MLDACTEAVVATLDDTMAHALASEVVYNQCGDQALLHAKGSAMCDLRLCLE